jgi:hypothetical protein
MNAKPNFTLVNFQDYSDYVECWNECPCCRRQDWEKLYLTDLVVDGRAIGKAYRYSNAPAWAWKLQSDHGSWPEEPEVNFSLDGSTWYSIWVNPKTYSDGVTKRTGMNGRSREEVPEDSPEHSEVMKAYERLTALVEAASAKEPPKQS